MSAKNGLLERVKHLEETIQNEREIRENAIQRERQLWEREVRILREALAPFYKSEQDVRRKLIELEDRIEGNYDEHVRLKERVVAVDDANMALERRVEDVEGSRSKRRRVGRPALHEDWASNGHVSPQARRVSPNTDERSVQSTSSRALSPNGVSTVLSVSSEHEEPRSSGILNLVEMARATPFALPQRLSPAQEEPRSSGFLALDLAERLNARKAGAPNEQETVAPTTAADQVRVQEAHASPAYARSNPDAPSSGHRSPRFQTATAILNRSLVDRILPPPTSLSPVRKRKYALEHMALDVLADVSVASPLIH